MKELDRTEMLPETLRLSNNAKIRKMELHYDSYWFKIHRVRVSHDVRLESDLYLAKYPKGWYTRVVRWFF